jgi:hypothetical protein
VAVGYEGGRIVVWGGGCRGFGAAGEEGREANIDVRAGQKCDVTRDIR